jgi:hypothetical protein
VKIACTTYESTTSNLHFSLVFLLNSVESKEAQCRKSTLKDHLRRSFQVLKLGRARNINSCINLCCSRSNCDLAILRNTRCYGITCSRHDLCRSIMNGLRERRHEISKRSTENTEGRVTKLDSISSQVADNDTLTEEEHLQETLTILYRLSTEYKFFRLLTYNLFSSCRHPNRFFTSSTLPRLLPT